MACAYLRVYEPLDAFPVGERDHWATYAASGRAPDLELAAAIEHGAAVAAVCGPTPRIPDSGEAFVAEWGGRTYICPWQLRQRSWAALSAFWRTLPPQVATAFAPESLAAAVERDLRSWRAAAPSHLLHIRTSTWHVPPHWFLLFDPNDRRGAHGAPPATGVVYRTAIVAARERIATACAVLEAVLGAATFVAVTEELAEWLGGFGADALVELDYSDLAGLLHAEGELPDATVTDVAAALSCLADSDVPGAAAAYARITERWRAVQAREAAN